MTSMLRLTPTILSKLATDSTLAKPYFAMRWALRLMKCVPTRQLFFNSKDFHMKREELMVAAIKNGTVIDHIPSGKLFEVVSLLRLAEVQTGSIMIGCNLASGKMGTKSIIKIADKFFEDDELNKLALLAPEATVNVIRDFKVVEKKKVELPKEISGIAKCMNPKCVTNHQPIKTKFATIQEGDKISLKCHYCEKITSIKHAL